jgi:hypothetical protein
MVPASKWAFRLQVQDSYLGLHLPDGHYSLMPSFVVIISQFQLEGGLNDLHLKQVSRIPKNNFQYIL